MSVTSTSGAAFLVGQPYYDNYLTNYFIGLLPDAKNNSSVLLGSISKRPHTAVSGRAIVWPIRSGRSTGLNSVAFGGVIPDPGRQGGNTAGTTTRKLMARISLDGDTIRHGKTNGGAYLEAQKLEMEGIIDDITIDRARQVHNDGSGRLAEISSVSTTTVTLKINSDIEGAANTRAAGTLENYIEVGMRVAATTNVGALGGATNQAGYFVKTVSVSGANVTITVSATVGGSAVDVSSSAGGFVPWAAGNWLVRMGAASSITITDTALRSEIMGIGGIFSDVGANDGVAVTAAQQNVTYSQTTNSTANFQGIVCSGNTWNQAVVLDNSAAGNRPITEALLQSAISDAERRNNANVSMLMSHPYGYDAYVALLTPDKRYQNTTDLKGGHTTLSFNNLPWVKDRFCYQNRVYFLALDQIEMLETQALTALTANDVTVWERLQDYDMYWRGWVSDDQVCVTGIRERCGAVLTELNA